MRFVPFMLGREYVPAAQVIDINAGQFFYQRPWLGSLWALSPRQLPRHSHGLILSFAPSLDLIIDRTADEVDAAPLRLKRKHTLDLFYHTRRPLINVRHWPNVRS